jgi:hypothetical protein
MITFVEFKEQSGHFISTIVLEVTVVLKELRVRRSSEKICPPSSVYRWGHSGQRLKGLASIT